MVDLLAPVRPLIGMAKAMPGVLKMVASMAKVESDGTPAIITLAVKAASAKDVKEIERQQQSGSAAATDELDAVWEQIAADITLSDAKRIRVEEKLVESAAMSASQSVISPETMAAIEESNKKKLEPTILSSLAPFTAIIGIPIFLTQLMKYLEPTGGGLSVDTSLTSPDPPPVVVPPVVVPPGGNGGGGGGGGGNGGGNGDENSGENGNGNILV